MPTARHIRLVSLVLICLVHSRAGAANLADLLRDPKFNRLELAPIAPVLASTVASTYPTASASSSVTYAYNPALEAFERQTRVGGPILGERAETIGKGQLNIAASFSYVHLTTINGDDFDSLLNRPVVNGRSIVFPVEGGVTLANGRFTNFLPVQVVADIDVHAYILSPSITYGVTPDLDVNLTVPLIHTSLDVSADTLVPDPRFPQFALPPGDPRAGSGHREASDGATGVGDLLLRAKYVLLRKEMLDLAAGLGLSLPTGDEDNFQGTGNTLVAPALILSHVFADRFEPLLNVGIDLNADDVSRSVVRWAIGGTAEFIDRLTLAVVVLGRHELSAQADPIANPFFFQIERNDIFDGSVGLRWRFADSGFLAANAVVPLNAEGLRPNVIPTLEVEYAFSVQ